MKPQCETAAQCLKELARVMEQFGIAHMHHAINSQYTRFNAVNEDSYDLPSEHFTSPSCWQFAIAEVECKPVFIGNELYHKDYGYKQIQQGCEYEWHLYSWNPPKPKTVMVELPTDVARYAAENWARDNKWLGDDAIAVGEACKLALEKLK